MSLEKMPEQLANPGQVRLPRFLPEMLQDHIDGAGTAYLMRRQGLRSGPLPMRDISRQEQQLRAHLAGLAHALDPKLERRLEALLAEPGTMTPEYAFVAAFLLLRCRREHYELAIVVAWREARRAQHRSALRDAMRLAGICTSAACEALVGALVQLAHAREGREALRILADSPVRPEAQLLLGRHRLAGELYFEAARLGLVALEPGLLFDGLRAGQLRPGGALEALLAQQSPRRLNGLTHRLLAEGQLPSSWQLFTLAATLCDDHEASEADWHALLACLRPAALAPKALWALPYTGRLEAVWALLSRLSPAQAHDTSTRQAFHLLTGIELDAYDQSADAPEDAHFLATLRRHKLPCPTSEITLETAREAWQKRESLCRLATPILLGRPRDLDALELAFEHMTTRQWRGWLELVAIRSQGRLRIPYDSFVEAQWARLREERTEVDRALFQPQSWDELPGPLEAVVPAETAQAGAPSATELA